MRKGRESAFCGRWGKNGECIANSKDTPHCKKDPIDVFSEMKLRGLVPSFHIHVMYLLAICIFPRSVHLFCCSKIGRPILGVFKSPTDTWLSRIGNETAHFILEIFVLNFRYSVFAVREVWTFNYSFSMVLAYGFWDTVTKFVSRFFEPGRLHLAFKFAKSGYMTFFDKSKRYQKTQTSCWF